MTWREQLQQALVCALDEVQATFACTGHTAGTTVTIIIQVKMSNGPYSIKLAKNDCILCCRLMLGCMLDLVWPKNFRHLRHSRNPTHWDASWCKASACYYAALQT